MKNIQALPAAVALLTLLSGCASITQGTTQNLAFAIDTPGASCVAVREGDGTLGTIHAASRTLLVSKDKDDIVITCNAPGHREKIVRLVSESDPVSLVGGFILDGGIVDAITGAAWIYPLETKIALDEEQPSLEDVMVAALQEDIPAELPVASIEVTVQSIETAIPEGDRPSQLAELSPQADPPAADPVNDPAGVAAKADEQTSPSFLADLADTVLPAEALITLASEIPGPDAPDFATEEAIAQAAEEPATQLAESQRADERPQ